MNGKCFTKGTISPAPLVLVFTFFLNGWHFAFIYVCIIYMQLQYRPRPEEGTRSSGIGVPGRVLLGSDRFWELNLSPLEDWPVLLVVESSLQYPTQNF